MPYSYNKIMHSMVIFKKFAFHECRKKWEFPIDIKRPLPWQTRVFFLAKIERNLLHNTTVVTYFFRKLNEFFYENWSEPIFLENKCLPPLIINWSLPNTQISSLHSFKPPMWHITDIQCILTLPWHFFYLYKQGTNDSMYLIAAYSITLTLIIHLFCYTDTHYTTYTPYII